MVRKELSSLYSVEWRHKDDDPDAEALLDHHYDVWCRDQGAIEHSPEVQQAALSIAPKLLQQGLIKDLPQWFLFLHQLDVLCSQTAWLVLHMVAFKRLPIDTHLENHDLKQPRAGSLLKSLSWVPACTAITAFNHLNKHASDWFSNDSDSVAALEAVQLLTGTATRNRKKTYPLTLKGLSALVSDFGQLSPGLLKPGPWVSPELGGARFPATDDALVPLRQGAGEEESLVSYLTLDQLSETERRPATRETRLIACHDDRIGGVSQADPAAILIAILEQELDRPADKPTTAICLQRDGWLADMHEERDDLPPAAMRRWLEDWGGRLEHHESVWRRAAEVFNQARRGFRPLVITANRPEPKWRDTAVRPILAVDHYWADTAEVNPRQSRCLATADVDVTDCVPDSAELLTTGGLSQARLVQTGSGRSALGAALANQDGLNLVVVSPEEAGSMESLLNNALSFTESQTIDDDPAPWLGLPIVMNHGRCDRLALAETLLEKQSELVRVMLPPDANTAMASLKAVYGVPGVVSLMCLPDQKTPLLTPEQAEQLARHGALCLSGNCAADIQLVACGGFALQDARALSKSLKKDGVAHSLVYVLEPARLLQWLTHRDSMTSLLPEPVHKRLFMTDLAADGWLANALTGAESSGLQLVDDSGQRQALITGKLDI